MGEREIDALLLVTGFFWEVPTHTTNNCGNLLKNVNFRQNISNCRFWLFYGFNFSYFWFL